MASVCCWPEGTAEQFGLAVALAVPPVVVALGEYRQCGERFNAFGGQLGLQALVKRVAGPVLAHGLAQVVEHAAPGLGAGLPGLGLRVWRQRLPLARRALAISAVQHRELRRGRQLAAQRGGGQARPQALAFWQMLYRKIEIPGFPDRDEHVVIALIAFAVDMPLAQRKIGLIKPPGGRPLLGADHGRAHGGEDVADTDRLVVKQACLHRHRH